MTYHPHNFTITHTTSRERACIEWIYASTLTYSPRNAQTHEICVYLDVAMQDSAIATQQYSW